MNMNKRLRTMKATGVRTTLQPHEVHINAMTNWQRSQWLRAGAIPAQAIDYVKLARIRVGTSA